MIPLKTSSKQDYETPNFIFNEVVPKLFDIKYFDLDVCASSENAKATEYYTILQDGLSQSWHDNTWCNPPYESIAKWVDKSISEATNKETQIIMLVPARVETQWAQKALKSGAAIVILTPRVAFTKAGKVDTQPPHASIFIAWNSKITSGINLFNWKTGDSY